MSDEKKISLEELEDLLDEDSGGGLNFQTILAALVLNWQWFLLSLIIFVSGALIYLRYAEPVYSISAIVRKRMPARFCLIWRTSDS